MPVDAGGEPGALSRKLIARLGMNYWPVKGVRSFQMLAVTKNYISYAAAN